MSFACNGAAKKILMSVTLALGFGFACGACSCRPVATPSDGGFAPASLQIALQSGFDDVYDSVVSCAKTDWSSFEGWWCDEENATSEFIDVRGMHRIEIFFIDEEKVEFNVFDVGRYPSHRITGCFESVTGFFDGSAYAFRFTDDRGGINEGSLEIVDMGRIYVDIHLVGRDSSIPDGAGGSAGFSDVLVRDEMKDIRIMRDLPDSDESANSVDYILPSSDSRLLIADDVSGLMPDEMELARNEIFARYGRAFEDPRIAQYFAAKPWYSATIAPERFDPDSMLNDIEKKNVEFIQGWEASWRGLSNGTSFVGVRGVYTCASVPGDSLMLTLRFPECGKATLDIETMNGDSLYSALPCDFLSDVEMTVEVGGAALFLVWNSPGEVRIVDAGGGLPEDLASLALQDTFWNSSYLHVS